MSIVRVVTSAHAGRRLWLLVGCSLSALVAPACSRHSANTANTAEKATKAARPKSAPAAQPRSAPAAQPKDVDPCRLLTVEQIKAATGWDLDAGVRDANAPPAAGAVCNWERVDGEAGVHLQFHASGGSALLAERRRSLAGRGTARTPHPVTVKGASEGFDVAAEGLLAIRVGDHYIQVNVIGGTAGIDDHLQLGADVADALT